MFASMVGATANTAHPPPGPHERGQGL